VSAAVLLVDPKYDHNVGGAVRACAVFGAAACAWTGSRVLGGGAEGLPTRYRLPREERLREYASVEKMWLAEAPDAVDRMERLRLTPVAVERRENAEPLDGFDHPADALYVFGPEDGSLGRGWLEFCHRFVVIPSAVRTPLNLAAAVNVVLYDRFAKRRGKP
jgi:tRNA(Leu) C34 or U34 (ribose-2'-O)-methylase TrmL